MGLRLRPSYGGGPSGSGAACGGVCPYRGPGGKNLAGHPQLRLRLAPLRATGNPEAVALAARHYAAIRFDPRAQAPWFRYVDGQGQEHEVWFEDARSIRSKLALSAELELYGVGYWNLMRPFPQNWAVLNSLYEIRTGD